MEKNRWAIRDIEHGKTFFFKDIEKLFFFVSELHLYDKSERDFNAAWKQVEVILKQNNLIGEN